MMKMAVLMPKVSILSPPLAFLTSLHRRHRHQPSISFPLSFPRRASFSSTARVSDANTTIPAEQQLREGEVKEEDDLREAGSSLDLRVGRITIAYRHPEADSLYVEEVEVGEAEPRIICSGLVNYIPINDLQGLSVVVLANLKPRNMRGVRSYGMLLAASDADHQNVELLLPPPDSLPGQRIWFGSAPASADDDDKPALPSPASPNQVQKKKIWESVQPHLKTDESGIASLGPHTMRTDGGVVVAKTLNNARIS